MKTKTLLQTTGLCILMMLLTTFYSNAQIQIQGLHADHEGTASWDADGTGPEPEGYGHEHPFGWANTPYYGSSIDYDNIDPDPEAALAHFLDDIIGFPLFEQALIDNGFTPGQVKIKVGQMSLKEDVEGEDWFTLNNQHHFNYYDGNFIIELNGEPMISGYYNFGFFSYDQSVYNSWHVETNFTKPVDASFNSSISVQNVAAAFLTDMDGEELRFIYNHLQSTGIFFNGNGRDGVFFEIVSGFLEKGLPELPFSGLAADHQGLACWDANGSGPEPEAYGHTYSWNGTDYTMPYYVASRDYDGIDPDNTAATGYITDELDGFPNLKIQLEYRGYSLDQLKLKTGLGSLGNDIEGIDWGYDGSIHWYTYYGYDNTFEIAGEPILESVSDTNHGFIDLAILDYWYSSSSFSKVIDISNTASSNAQYVALSFLKDLGGHSLGSYVEGYISGNLPPENGRVDGVFMELQNSKLIARQPAGTHIWENEVSGTWDLARSPFIIMGALEIPDGETLIIEPGVVVQFNTTEMFLINGCIIAEGTENDPILFTAYEESIPWGGIGIPDIAITNEPISLKHCIFEYSYAYNPDNLYGFNCGGVIRIDNYEQIEISHCTFRHNSADKFLLNNPTGGAIMLNQCSIHISHCIFHDNSSPWGGAIAILDNSDPVIDNCLFYNNEATTEEGGAVLVWTDSEPHFVNCTFADNHASLGGGAAALQLGGTTTFTNCVFWGNTANSGPSQIDIWMENPPSLNVYYCDVEEGLNGITPGFQGEYLYNIDADPYFQAYEGYQYIPDTSLSITIDAGTQFSDYLPLDYVFPEFCLMGNPRIDAGEVDMGCYEYDDLGTGISNASFQDKLMLLVFPNPINSNPTIEFFLNNEQIVQVSILDIHGRLVSEVFTKKLNNGKNQLSLNAEKLAPGIYFCLLNVGNEVFSSKVVKLK